MTDIRLEGIVKSFDGRAVFDGLTLTIPAGETTCVMGPSGCGKTTLLNILAGLVKPDGGAVTGVPERVAFVFQEDRLCEAFLAVSNVRLVTGKRVSREAVAAALGELGLGESLDQPVASFSGGMKRRVAVARAVLYGAELLLLDEAFKGLDEERKRLTMDYIKAHTAGKTVVCVTHDPEEAAYLGGRIVELGTP